MATMSFANIGDKLGETGFAQPARCETSQDPARAHVQPKIKCRFVDKFALRSAFAGDDEEKAQIAQPRSANEGDERAMRIALRHAVKIKPRLRFEQPAAQPFGRVSVDSDRTPRVRL